jgi:uncharacterized protein YbjT (DUF2867 family)
MARSALVVGATGLVGGACLRALLSEPVYARVAVLARRALDATHAKLTTHVVDFEALAADSARGATALVPPDALSVDDVYACLGTTMKAAGSEARFRRVDHDYTLAVAQLARRAGAKRLGLVSSVGAGVAAQNFYLRVKGETERDLRALEFEVLEIARPSVLLGERRDARPGEAIAMRVLPPVAPLFVGPMRQYRPIDAGTVANALIAALLRGNPGAHVRTYAELVALEEALRMSRGREMRSTL